MGDAGAAVPGRVAQPRAQARTPEPSPSRCVSGVHCGQSVRRGQHCVRSLRPRKRLTFSVLLIYTVYTVRARSSGRAFSIMRQAAVRVQSQHFSTYESLILGESG